MARRTRDDDDDDVDTNDDDDNVITDLEEYFADFDDYYDDPYGFDDYDVETSPDYGLTGD